MPLSWNEIRSRALAFSREWQQESSEDAETKSFWDGFFNVFGISRRRVATFEEPLKTDKPEAYTYCLDALRRFEEQSRDAIFSVVSEIGVLGMNGIDHTTTSKTYTIKAYPGETFSGLHLLCLMYVGFKLYDPAVNCGIDFAEAYEMALGAHKANIH